MNFGKIPKSQDRCNRKINENPPKTVWKSKTPRKIDFPQTFRNFYARYDKHKTFRFFFLGRKNILRFPVLFMQFEIPCVIHAIRALRVTKFELLTNGDFYFEKLKRIWGSVLATESVYILVGVQKYLRWHDFIMFQNFGSVFSPWRLSETINFVILTVPTLARVQKPSWKLRKNQNHKFSTISAHQRPIDTSSDVIPNPRSAWASREKNHRLLTSQTANSLTFNGKTVTQTARSGIFPKFVQLWSTVSPSSRGVRSSDYVRCETVRKQNPAILM